MSNTNEYDVIIVGLGPCGVSAANFLGMRGVRTLVLERDEAVYPRQRAIAIDEDALRAWQSVGLVDEVLADMDREILFHCESKGRRFLTMQMSADGDQCMPRFAFFHQPFLEQSLRNGLKRFPSVEVKTRHEMTALSQEGDHVVVKARGLKADGTPDGQTHAFRAQYVLGCDGGSSPTRKAAGIPLPGYSIEEPWLDVQALAKDKRRNDAPMDFVFFCDPERSGVDCAGLDGYHRWEFRLNAGEDPQKMDTLEGIRGLLAVRNINVDDVTIVKHWIYTFHIRQAEMWRKKRVFLCGDAAHIMPPFAGQGISSAVRDVNNLCWKLAAVISGAAKESILDSYESERRPNVEALTKLSLLYGRVVMLQQKWLVPIRDHGIRLLTRMPFLGKAIRDNRFKPKYRLGPGLLSRQPASGSPAGQYIPQPWVVTATGYRERLDDVLGNDGWIWLSWKESTLPAALRERGVREIIVRHRDDSWKQMPANEVVDIEDSLRSMFRKHRASGLLIRPDRFIYGCDRDDLSVKEFNTFSAPLPAPVIPTKDMNHLCSARAEFGSKAAKAA